MDTKDKRTKGETLKCNRESTNLVPSFTKEKQRRKAFPSTGENFHWIFQWWYDRYTDIHTASSMPAK